MTNDDRPFEDIAEAMVDELDKRPILPPADDRPTPPERIVGEIEVCPLSGARFLACYDKAFDKMAAGSIHAYALDSPDDPLVRMSEVERVVDAWYSDYDYVGNPALRALLNDLRGGTETTTSDHKCGGFDPYVLTDHDAGDEDPTCWEESPAAFDKRCQHEQDAREGAE